MTSIALDQSEPIVARALADGAIPEVIEVGQVYRRVPMLCLDGRRMKGRLSDYGYTRIRITGVPGGRRRRFAYVKVDPRPMGNGRPDRGEHRLGLHGLLRNYALEAP